MAADFSRAAFDRFLEERRDREFVSQGSAAAYRSAAISILHAVSPTADMRKVDLNTVDEMSAGSLSPSTRSQYKRRMELAIQEFLKYAADPVTYWTTAQPQYVLSELATGQMLKLNADRSITPTARRFQYFGESAAVSGTDSLSVPFPLRPNFVAQVNVPRDLKAAEAKRLCQFIMMLAQDFNPEAN